MLFISSKEKKTCTDERDEDIAGSLEEMESLRSRRGLLSRREYDVHPAEGDVAPMEVRQLAALWDLRRRAPFLWV
ncbi:hypothetical protein DVH24_038089 [Malus domestica]|uniref:Uncharacterized protein n=1 Tax=Malus domestica TaxID=3750 RepID=A0A498KDB4_MALDO|nr:hypothetical protein DVH24_038089 [Malus domestica]